MQLMDITVSELNEVKRVAREAGKILLEMSQKIGPVIHKDGGAGLLTEADKKSEDFILQSLSKSFPDTVFLSEEAGFVENGKLVKSIKGLEEKGLWIIDPLDGTNNFAHGFPWYCVSIGLEINQEVCLGVIYQPVLDEMFYAVKGQGAFLNEQRIKVTREGQMKNALLGVGFYYYKDDILEEEIQRFGRVHQKVLGIRRAGSAALDMVYVAAGRLDGFWEKGLNPWDMAAGKIIASEAGARISDYSGQPFSLYGKELLLTNGLLHEPLISLLNS